MRWLLSSIGYLLYTLTVLVFLLWMLFPAETVKTWLEQQLDARYPQYVWSIGSFKPVFPGRLELADITITIDRNKKPVVQVARLDLVPDLVRIFGKSRLVRYQLHLPGGIVAGRFVAAAGDRQFECRGRVNGLQLEKLRAVQQLLQRKLTGTASGEFTGQGIWKRSGKMELKGKVNITGGMLQLREPVLGLAQLPYTKIETNFQYHDGQWEFKQGKLVSSKMTADFSGRIKAAGNFESAVLQLTGRITPRPELFAGTGDRKMARVVHTFLKDGGLPFTVSGTAVEPAIHFEGGFSQALKRLQGAKR